MPKPPPRTLQSANRRVVVRESEAGLTALSADHLTGNHFKVPPVLRLSSSPFSLSFEEQKVLVRTDLKWGPGLNLKYTADAVNPIILSRVDINRRVFIQYFSSKRRLCRDADACDRIARAGE
jgi:hypothetical protein